MLFSNRGRYSPMPSFELWRVRVVACNGPLNRLPTTPKCRNARTSDFLSSHNSKPRLGVPLRSPARFAALFHSGLFIGRPYCPITTSWSCMHFCGHSFPSIVESHSV